MRDNIVFTDEYVLIARQNEDTASNNYINSLLTSLVSSGDAEQHGSEFRVSNFSFSNLSEEELAIIEAPTFYPYQVKIDSNGSFSDKDFSYGIYFLNEDGRPYYLPRRIGCLIKLGDQEFTLHSSQYSLVFEIEKSNNIEIPEGIEKSELLYRHMEPFVGIRELAEQSNSQIDDYLREQNIILPESIRPQIDIFEDGSIRVSPQVGTVIIDKDEPQFVDILTTEQSEEYVYKMKSPGFTRKTVKIKSGDEKDIRVLNTPEVREGISEICEIQNLDAESAADFIDNPHQYLTSKVFHLADFSKRVVEVAELKFITNVGISKGRMKIDWDNLILSVGDPTELKLLASIQVNTPNDLKILENAVRRANEESKDYVVYKGVAIERNEDELIRFMEGARDIFILDGKLGGDKEQAARNARNIGIDKESKSIGLKIKANIVELEETQLETHDKELNFNPRIPESLNPSIKLFPFQIEGVHWLQRMSSSSNSGVLLADDMGLGKTIQILSFLVDKLEKGDQGPFLIIAPVTLLDNWNNELVNMFISPFNKKCLIIYRDFVKRHGTRGAKVKQRDGSIIELPYKKIIDDDGKTKLMNAGIIITNYETVRDYQLSFGEIVFKVIVCDEAQKIKNPSTHVTNAVKGMNAEFRIISSATPVENSLVDLWCLVDFLIPGKLGSLREFSKIYVPAQNAVIKPEKIRELRDKLDKDHIILRRTKKEQLDDLPDKTESEEFVKLGAWQLELYANLVNIARMDSSQTLPVIISLIALCSHPSLLVPSELSSPEKLIADCPKLFWTLDKLRAIQSRREKVLIFTRLKKMQRVLLTTIFHQFPGINEVGIINGDTPPQTRQQIIDRFNQSDGFNILILSPEAAGIGLNITGANHVIHYTRLWNPAKEDQATDRVYRIGQKKNVYVYYPISIFPESSLKGEKTIEQHLGELLHEKRDVMKEFLIPTDSLDIQKELFTRIECQGSDNLNSISLSDMDRLSWDQFEVLVSLLFKKRGFRTQLTKRIADYGVDVIISDENNDGHALVQCKILKENSMTSSGIREVVTARRYYEDSFKTKFPKLFIFVTTDLTKEARHLSSKNEVEVVSRSELQRMLIETPIFLSEILVESMSSII